MITLTRRLAASLALLGVLTASTAMAQESLLWKTVNSTPASVVPPYTGQEGPFPRVVEEVVSATAPQDEALAEQQRQRDNAYNYAEGLLKSGKGFQPEMRLLRVGGMVEGNLGPRVLLNNQWVGVGTKVPVRLTKTAEIQEAIKLLANFDEAAASQMGQKLDGELSSNPLLQLSVQKITSQSLVLGAPGGKTYPINFNISSQ